MNHRVPCADQVCCPLTDQLFADREVANASMSDTDPCHFTSSSRFNNPNYTEH